MKYFLLFILLITVKNGYSQAWPSQETTMSEVEIKYLFDIYGEDTIRKSKEEKSNDQGIMIFVAQNICSFYPNKINDFWKQFELIRKYFKGNLSLYLNVWDDNPLNLMIKNNDYVSFDKLVKLDNRFLNAAPYDDSGQKRPSPIVTSILEDDINWVKHIVLLGGDIHSDDGVYPRNYNEPYRMNLLSIASINIQDYLIQSGIEKYGKLVAPYDSHCLDDGVNIRKEPTLSSSILFKINKENEFKIIGNTFLKYNINQSSFYWVQIEINGVKGWIYGEYVYIYYE